MVQEGVNSQQTEWFRETFQSGKDKRVKQKSSEQVHSKNAGQPAEAGQKPQLCNQRNPTGPGLFHNLVPGKEAAGIEKLLSLELRENPENLWFRVSNVPSVGSG